MSETEIVIRANKNAAIIVAISELFGVTLQEATNIYYQSETSQMIDEKIADLHCRSEKYLASLVWEEYLENSPRKSVEH